MFYIDIQKINPIVELTSPNEFNPLKDATNKHRNMKFGALFKQYKQASSGLETINERVSRNIDFEELSSPTKENNMICDPVTIS